MTLPPHVIEAGARALHDFDTPDEDYTAMADGWFKQGLREQSEAVITAALQALWQPIESAPDLKGFDEYRAIILQDAQFGEGELHGPECSEPGWWWAGTYADHYADPVYPTHFIDLSFLPLPQEVDA